MRFLAIAYMGALVVTLAAFRLHTDPEAPLAVAPSDVFAPEIAVGPAPADAVAIGQPGLAQNAPGRTDAPSEIEPTAGVGRIATVEIAQSQEATAEQVPPPAPPRRRYRRRYRNRYPGPIPTPADWAPPEGPVRIALQAGHWRADEAPRELSGLRRNGTRWGETAEWEMNLEIVRAAATMLEEMGYVVDILPAVVPPSYRAHLFIAVHADGSNDPNASGYRVAAPSRDATGRASGIVALLRETYGQATGIKRLPTVTRRMRNYYAFNFRRYEHALHPMTIAVIIETGFLTSQRDRRVIVDDPERAARGIVEAIAAFPLTPPPGVAGDK